MKNGVNMKRNLTSYNLQTASQKDFASTRKKLPRNSPIKKDFNDKVDMDTDTPEKISPDATWRKALQNMHNSRERSGSNSETPPPPLQRKIPRYENVYLVPHPAQTTVSIKVSIAITFITMMIGFVLYNLNKQSQENIKHKIYLKAGM
jgi:hypothetical protein